jgi:two-component system, NtrC family, response regulator
MSEKKIPLLIVEDDEGLRRQYRWAFAEFDILAAGSREEALSTFSRVMPPVAIVDLGLPPDPDGASEGLAALESMRQLAPASKIIIATGNENRQYALRAIELGAYDFYQKPIDIDVLRVIINRAVHLYDLEAENRRLAIAVGSSPVDGIIANSSAMLKVLRSVEKIGPADVAVLLLGESGTGKELLAHAVHRASVRAKGPFVAINCAAIPETLLESELFGHEKGAFTGAVKQTIGKIESASGGTLFLDEIGDLPLPMQVKLLRFLQDHVVERIGGRQRIQVDVRVVCATHQDLDNLMATGRFREDLYYRLNEVKILVPPLREREGDAILLATYFLAKFNSQFSRKVKGFSGEALAAVKSHAWRGNVRELENRVKRAVIMAESPLLNAADLDLGQGAEVIQTLDLRQARARAEREVVQMAIAQSGGNISNAAKLLGISRPTLYDLVKEHGLAVEV